jgi:hypothetical protein
MADPNEPHDFASRLLRQDEPVREAVYQAYRDRLEVALRAAEWRENWAGRVVAVACVVSFALMFVGGSKWLGDFDPWSKDATALSVTAAVVYLLATLTFFLGLASYYSRFRPGVRDAKERLRDAAILDLQRQVRELREQVERNARRVAEKP